MSESLAHLAPESVVLTAIQPIDRLIGEVAAYLGGEDDPIARMKALSFLDRAADRMNAFGVFLFEQREEVYDSISSGDTTIAIPSNFGWPVDPVVARKTGGKVTRIMHWTGYHHFRQSIAGDTTSTTARSVPQFITYKSEYDTNFEFWPPANMDDFDEIALSYLSPIDRPSEVSNQAAVRLLAPVRESMLTGGIALMMQFRYQTQPALYKPHMDDFERWLTRARASATRRQQAEHAVITPVEMPFTPAGLRRSLLYIGFR